jgi:hypothetical protein
MQRQFPLVVIVLAAFSIISTDAYAQGPIDYGLYCTAGLHPDGYIDFSGLPPAPEMNPPSMHPLSAPSASVTATLPVHGVAGLTVTVTIPPLYGSHSTPQPAYTVDGGTLKLNGISQTDSGSVLILTFSQPIVGVGLHTLTSGRFSYNATLQAGLPPVDSPGIFATTSTGYTYDDLNPQTQNLQMVGLSSTLFQTASVQVGEDESNGIVTLSNVRVQSASAPDPASVVPMNGLQQWLRADKTDGTLAGPYSHKWADQSGHGHDALAGNVAPSFTADGATCQAAFQFTGNQSFNFNLPIAGWDEMSIFLVAEAGNDAGSYANNTAIFWTGAEAWGDTFVSPYQTHVYGNFGTSRRGSYLFYTRPGGGIGQDFTTTRAVHDDGTDTLYVNGLLVQSREGNLPLLTGGNAGTIGQGFDGEISEILVYNRVLSVDEAALVENYLAQKYGSH